MKRRQFLASVGAVGMASTAGCMGIFSEEEELYYSPDDFPYIDEDKIVIHWMYRGDKEECHCPSLDQQRPYLREIAKEYPEKIAIIEYKVTQNEKHMEIYNAFREKLDFETDNTPLTVVDTISFVGYNQSIEDSIDDRIKEFLDKPSEAFRHNDVMGQFYDLEDPEPREEEEPGILEKIQNVISDLLSNVV